MHQVFFIIAYCYLLVSCGPSSMTDFRKEGQAVVEQLVQDLNGVETREDLVKLIPKLQQEFQELVAIMISAREFQESRSRGEGHEFLDFSEEDQLLSDQLRSELERIYSIEDGKEIIEKCQSHALETLDLYEKQQARKKALYSVNGNP